MFLLSGVNFSGAPDTIAKARWYDSEYWTDDELLICHSVGRLIFEDKDSVVLAPHWSGDEDALRLMGGMRIPKSVIRRRVEISTDAKKCK